MALAKAAVAEKETKLDNERKRLNEMSIQKEKQ